MSESHFSGGNQSLPSEELQSAVPRVSGAPDRIVLCVGDIPVNTPFGDLQEVTWCASSQNNADIEYVRADLAAPAAPFIILEGLDKRLLAPREIVRDADGHLTHPDLPVCDESTRYDLFLAAFGLEASVVSMESDCKDQALLDRYFDDGDPDCSAWVPSTPEGEGWVLLEIYPTEDGPYALFVRRKAVEKRIRRRRASPAPVEDAIRTAGLNDVREWVIEHRPAMTLRREPVDRYMRVLALLDAAITAGAPKGV